MRGKIQAAFDPSELWSLSGRARARRWQMFQRNFPRIQDMSVLDLGGTPTYWLAAPARPASVRCVNLDPSHAGQVADWLECVTADACQRQSGDYDLVVSNSLLEHLGGHAMRQRLAETIHATAPRHWVQTPYRYFPIEPHWVFPGFQFLPKRVKMNLSRRWPLGHIRSREAAWSDVSWVELIDVTDMRGYFPHSRIWYERFSGLVKSLVAIRN